MVGGNFDNTQFTQHLTLGLPPLCIAVYRRSSRRPSASISAPLAAFFFAELGSLHGAFICAYLEISNLT